MEFSTGVLQGEEFSTGVLQGVESSTGVLQGVESPSKGLESTTGVLEGVESSLFLFLFLLFFLLDIFREWSTMEYYGVLILILCI